MFSLLKSLTHFELKTNAAVASFGRRARRHTATRRRRRATKARRRIDRAQRDPRTGRATTERTNEARGSFVDFIV
jgi:hypothetical protein